MSGASEEYEDNCDEMILGKVPTRLSTSVHRTGSCRADFLLRSGSLIDATCNCSLLKSKVKYDRVS